MTLIQINQLSKQYKCHRKPFFALKNINFEIRRGEAVGLVGASGSGKTTLGKVILGLVPPTEGEVVTHFSSSSLRKSMQMVFQNPHSSLNPKMTVYDLIAEPLLIHKIVPNEQTKKRVLELLKQVEIDPACLHCHPDQLSGGQKQRVAIARALASEPEFVVFDEAVSSLDASLQAQMIHLLRKLHRDSGLTFLFIAHDLSIVKSLTDRVAVLYSGQIVEEGQTDTLFTTPRHPYTQELLNSSKLLVHSHKSFLTCAEQSEEYKGCPFYNHCPLSEKICAEHTPPFHEHKPRHWVACHRSYLECDGLTSHSK